MVNFVLSFQNYSSNFRFNNMATHRLLKEAVKDVMDKVWMEEIPSCIYDIAFSEQFALFCLEFYTLDLFIL